MLYLIGGTARAGKTTIAKRFLKETGIPYFSLDYLMMGISRGVPELNVDPNGGNFIIAKKLLQVVNPMVIAMLENRANYLIEGVQLIPKHIKELQVKFPKQVRACFVGFSNDDVRRKCKELSTYSSLSENDWSRHYSEDKLKLEVEKLISESVKIRDECKLYGITYFDITDNYNETIDIIVNYLKSDI